MGELRMYWPDFYTEYHKEPQQGEILAGHLKEFGITCVKDSVDGCDVAFCGSFFRYGHLREALRKRVDIPIIHYSWDIYPWQVEDTSHSLSVRRWAEYIEELKDADAIFVPSQAAVARHYEYVGVEKDVRVVKCSMRPFDVPEDWAAPDAYRYVVDVMRHYPDRNCGLVKRVCDRLGIPCIETRASLSWDDYRKTIYGAHFLVSTYEEASTGGLSLLEGHWYGTPILLCNSPKNGGQEYFGTRATYFQWDDEKHFETVLRSMWEQPPTVDVQETRNWLKARYSERSFARRLMVQIRDVLESPPRFRRD